MTLDLIYVPDPLLKQVSKPVEKIDDELLELLDNMLETMYKKEGIGLAGIQVGVPKRIITMDLRDKDVEIEEGEDGDKIEKKKRKPRIFINPKFVWQSEDETLFEEGCLSIPQQRIIVERPKKIKLKYLDRKGNEKLLEADELLSKCIQHEMDHLNGILLTDYLSKLKRDYTIKKVKKLIKHGNI